MNEILNGKLTEKDIDNYLNNVDNNNNNKGIFLILNILLYRK